MTVNPTKEVSAESTRATSSNVFATPYGISCVQEGVMAHQIHVARSDLVSLEGKNIHDFYQYVLRRSMGEAGRSFLNNIWDFIDLSTHQLHRRLSSVLQLLGSPHLASRVKAEGPIDIEAILKALIAYRKDNGPKIIEVHAVSEMRNLSLEILDIVSKAAFEAYTDWQCKIDDIRERSIRYSTDFDSVV
jgi:hypothetical protein